MKGTGFFVISCIPMHVIPDPSIITIYVSKVQFLFIVDVVYNIMDYDK